LDKPNGRSLQIRLRRPRRLNRGSENISITVKIPPIQVPPAEPPKPQPSWWKQGAGKVSVTFILPALAAVVTAWAIFYVGPSATVPPQAMRSTGAASPPAVVPVGGGGSRGIEVDGPAQAPLTVNVTRSNDPGLSACIGWLFPKSSHRLPRWRFSRATANSETDEQWALENGGVDLSPATYQVSVWGKPGQSVLFQVNIAVIGRRPAPSGKEVYNETGCGGGIVDTVFYTANVSQPDPRLLEVPGISGKRTQPSFYANDSGSPDDVVLQTVATNPHYEYSYTYVIDWWQGSRSGVYEIYAPSGKPFVVTQGG
jgi:hypothetical protein